MKKNPYVTAGIILVFSLFAVSCPSASGTGTPGGGGNPEEVNLTISSSPILDITDLEDYFPTDGWPDFPVFSNSEGYYFQSSSYSDIFDDDGDNFAEFPLDWTPSGTIPLSSYTLSRGNASDESVRIAAVNPEVEVYDDFGTQVGTIYLWDWSELETDSGGSYSGGIYRDITFLWAEEAFTVTGHDPLSGTSSFTSLTYNVSAVPGWNIIITEDNLDIDPKVRVVRTGSMPEGFRWLYLEEAE